MIWVGMFEIKIKEKNDMASRLVGTAPSSFMNHRPYIHHGTLPCNPQVISSIIIAKI